MGTLHKTPEQAKAYFEDKMAFSTGPVELNRMLERSSDKINVVDVREKEDYEKGHVPGAVNLPQSEWENLSGLDKDKVNILYCYSTVCHLAAKAAIRFADSGFKVMELDGGFKEWTAHRLNTESGSLKNVG